MQMASQMPAINPNQKSQAKLVPTLSTIKKDNPLVSFKPKTYIPEALKQQALSSKSLQEEGPQA